jgi:hypothetical protein
MTEKLYSYNQLKVGDRFTSTKHIGVYIKACNGDTLIPFGLSDNLVITENGEIDLWTDDPKLLNDECLIKLD